MGKNLNFSPTPGSHNKKILLEETNELLTKIKLKSHFGTDNNMEKTEENIFKKKSNWEPTNIHHSVQTFCDAIRNDINDATRKPARRSNLTKEEKEAMEKLRTRDDLIFTKADKGGCPSHYGR